MPIPQGPLIRLAVLAVAILFSGSVEANKEILIERQNPLFITELPTNASSSVVVVTATPATTVEVPPSQVPITSQAPLQTPTPAPTADPIPTTFLTVSSSSTTPPLATATPSIDPAANASTSTGADDPYSVVGNTFFGRVPTALPDAPVTGAFLLIFLLLAIAHWIYYRASGRRSRWGANKADLSRLAALFCLARVATCILRLVWIAFPRSAVVVSVAVITDNAGTILLVVLNFYLTKRMISFCDLKYSLWARSVTRKVSNATVGIVFTATFLLNALGVVSFEIEVTNGRNPTTEEHLVQASKALMILFSLLFNLAVFFAMATFSWSRAEQQRLTVKVVTYMLGAGLLTAISQLVQGIAAFMIWRPVTPLSAQVLSKPAYYIAGFGAEVLIMILYGFWETNLFALTRESFFPRPTSSDKATSDRSATQSPDPNSDGSRPPSSSSTAQILPKQQQQQHKAGGNDSVSSRAGSDVAATIGEKDASFGLKHNKLNLTIISGPTAEKKKHREAAGAAGAGFEMASRAPLGITVHKEVEVTVSLSTVRASAIGKAV